MPADRIPKCVSASRSGAQLVPLRDSGTDIGISLESLVLLPLQQTSAISSCTSSVSPHGRVVLKYDIYSQGRFFEFGL